MPIPELNGVPALVTGGTGFIGSHLVDALLERGANVRVLDNFLTGKRENLAHCSNQIDLVQGDIRDIDTCRRACDGIAYLFPEAALGSVPRSMKDPATTFAVNIAGTANVFTAARDAGVKRVVYASSSSVYGDSEKLPKREGEEGHPLSPYALSKLENAAVRRGEGPVIYGDGTQSRDLTFVSDVARANLLAAGAIGAAWGRVFNVAPGSWITINDLARTVLEVCGGGPPPMYLDPRPGDILHSRADYSAAASAFGFSAQIPLSEGIRRTSSHFPAGEGKVRP